MKIFLVFVLTVMVSSASYAQDKFGEGFYVTNNSDTVHGYLGYKSKYKDALTFRADLKSPVQLLSIDNVKSFGFASGSTFMRTIHPDKKESKSIFVKPLVHGEIDFFNYGDKMIIGSDAKGWYELAKKASNGPDALKNRQKNTGVFNILFQDCPSVRESAQEIQISQENIKKLISDYHSCRNLPYKEVNVIKSRSTVDFGFFAGMNFSSIDFKTPDDNTEVDPANSPTFGLTMLVKGKSPASLLSFQSGLAFSSGDHEGTWTYTVTDLAGYDITRMRTTSVKYNMLSLTAGLRLTIRSNKLNPYFGIGASGRQFISLEENVHQVTKINTGESVEDLKLGIAKTSFGLWGAAGVRKRVRGGKSIFAEFNYEAGNFSMDQPENAKVTNASVRLGFLF